MHNIRCQCGKIVCQVASVPDSPQVRTVTSTEPGPAAFILCRHCKRYVVLQVPAVTGVAYATTLAESQSGSFLVIGS